jgi:formamidopyrimidine-DNA glycosylase
MASNVHYHIKVRGRQDRIVRVSAACKENQVPELPDVEVLKQYLDATSLHQDIQAVEVRDSRILEDISSERLKTGLKDHSFDSTRRHGKYLFAELSDGCWLVLHFGMSGELKYFKSMEKDPEYDQLLISFSNGYHLAYNAPRKLGLVALIEDMETFVQKKELGPDAMGLDLTSFQELLSGRRGMVKSTLMNQQIIAGIGNVYSDEILFQARIHPRIGVKELDQETLRQLFNTMREVLQTAIDCRAIPDQFPSSYLTRHRNEGESCPNCGG